MNKLPKLPPSNNVQEYNYKMLQMGDSALRINLKTGQTWILSNKELKWVPIPEANPSS